jgi:2'-5' RNA ligase
MRLFLGIELPVEFKTNLALSVAPLQKDLKGWENPHDYHMTLLFIGETPLDKIPSLSLRLKEIAFRPFKLTFRSITFFPRRVMYLSCDPSEPLLQLKRTIDAAYPEYLRENEKQFTPHITLKRYQRYEQAELEKKIGENPFRENSVVVDHLALFKSERDRDNHKYHLLERS